jgi:hypothetical protein
MSPGAECIEESPEVQGMSLGQREIDGREGRERKGRAHPLIHRCRPARIPAKSHTHSLAVTSPLN